MYVHLGSGTVVREQEIIGIFDMDYCSVGKRTREFLAKAQRAAQVVNVTDELPKSFVLCEGGGKTALYISGISTSTLTRRAQAIEY